VSSLVHQDLVAHVGIPGHGKLLWDPDLLPLAYASNVAEPYLYEINLETKQKTRELMFSTDPADANYCPGTHGLAYSKKNKHVYATCQMGAGLMEVDTAAFQVVTKHALPSFLAYETKDQNYIVGINPMGNSVHVVAPGASGAASSQAFPSINGTAKSGSMAGGPFGPAFHQLSDGSWRLFFALSMPRPDGESGMGWIDTNTIEANNDESRNLRFIPGGQSSGMFRWIAEGNKYVALPTVNPQSGLTIVEAEPTADADPYLKGLVQTNLNPHFVVWVPDSYQGTTCDKDEKDDDKLSDGEIAGVAIAVVVIAAIVLALGFYCCKRRNGMDIRKNQNVERLESKAGSVSVTGKDTENAVV